MRLLLPLAAAALTMTGGAAMAQTYSIQISGTCDHLTLTASSGAVYGESDTADCDTSALSGTGTGLKSTVGGDLGFASTYAWSWDVKLGHNGKGKATLRGYDGTNVYGPSVFKVTYTTGASSVPPRSNGLPPASAAFRR